jgi:hypothetical protein
METYEEKTISFHLPLSYHTVILRRFNCVTPRGFGGESLHRCYEKYQTTCGLNDLYGQTGSLSDVFHTHR